MELTEELLIDPIHFAQWVADTYLVPTIELESQTLCPSPAEVTAWEISDSEITLCQREFVLMAAAGVTVTIAKNLSYEYYNSFINALCGRLVRLQYGHFGAAIVNETKDNIEHYISLLESDQIVAFATRYTERVFDGNPHEADIFAAQLWQRAMDVMLQTMSASRASIVTFLASNE